MSTTVTDTHALLSDIGPTRATVEYLGTEEECYNTGIYRDEYTHCTLVPVVPGLTISVGERVWIDRAGETVLRVSAGA